ncbi:MAG: family 16 glycosylhydrolase [Bacteroidales bacterium]|nr:family 16 glycosylhydrolase [Bacteroidales bacterium]
MMIKFGIIPLLTFMLSVGMSANAQCFELVWSDEFDYNGYPDANVWTPEEGGGGWGNNESQYYTSNDLDNAKVENGFLTITALKENFEGNEYTSARLITKGKINFQYGKIEARIKLPYGQGIWPAFWMMGENIDDVGWPACGEIDIMEFVGGDDTDNKVHGTVHWDNSGSHAQYGSSYSLAEGIFANDFHTFSVEWTPESVRWYVDNIQYNVIDITPSGLSEFHQDFFILLNLAVGGNWPGYPDASTVFPQTLVVDYVRVYKKSGEISEMSISGNTVLPQNASRAEYFLPFSPDWTYEWSVPEDAEIVDGQGTERIILNWGCTSDTLHCLVTGQCGTYHFSYTIAAEDSIYGPQFIDENEEAVTFHVLPMEGTDYNWTFPEDATLVYGTGNDTLVLNWGETFDSVALELTNRCGTKTIGFETVKRGKYPYPDIYSKHHIPGIIEAVHFDYGGEGVSYHDNSAGNEGGGPRQDTDVDTENNDNGNPNVGWIRNGEWLEYLVHVDSASWYRINLRAATDNSSGGPFSILFNGTTLLSDITVSGTGSWSSFTTIEAGTVYLSETDTLMRLYFNAGGFNLGKITFTPTTEPDSFKEKIGYKIGVYPVPARSQINISGLTGSEEISLFNASGQIVGQQRNNASGNFQLDIDGLENGIYFIKIFHSNGNFTFHKMIKI